MIDQCEIVYIPDIAKMLGRSESSIRSGVQGGAAWIPKSFKMGNRICWLKSDVMQFLVDCRDGNIQTKPKRPGRKRQVPPTFQSISR